MTKFGEGVWLHWISLGVLWRPHMSCCQHSLMHWYKTNLNILNHKYTVFPLFEKITFGKYIEIYCNLHILLSTFNNISFFILLFIGTYTAEEVNDEGRFKYYFMAFTASIDAWNCCLPVISVDGAGMKNKYLGTLISTCTINGNSQIVSLAFVVDFEDNLSWTWFFS